MEWIDTKTPPKPNHPVLVCIQDTSNSGKVRRFVSLAAWVPRFFEEDEGNYEGASEYNEENDTYYWPEGWYEEHFYDGTHWRIDGTVTYWAAVPGLPDIKEA